tara:strand:- start:3744 stop:4145 length:402 start_codon:yes stop_codon:yes gene_type:complete
MGNPIYTDLDVKNLKQIINIIDSDDNSNKCIIIKFTAEWCGPCQRIKDYCYKKFGNYNNSILCFDIDIESDDNIELYHAYKQKKMVTSIPTIISYYKKENRDSNHWWVPDLLVNSAKQFEIENFFNKIDKLVK